MALCPDYPLTPILIINHPLSASSIYYNLQHPHSPIYMFDSRCTTTLQVLYGLPLGLAPFHFILYTSLHPIIVFFVQHMLINNEQ